MIIVKFTKNPDGTLWIGWAEYENGTYFASGHTMDNLVCRMKQCLYAKKRVSFSQVWLDTKQSTKDDVPVELMTKMFRTKYWRDYQRTPAQSAQATSAIEKTKNTEVVLRDTDTTKYDYYEYKVRDGKLVVYGIVRREINSFDLRKPNIEGGNDDTNEQ